MIRFSADLPPVKQNAHFPGERYNFYNLKTHHPVHLLISILLFIFKQTNLYHISLLL